MTSIPQYPWDSLDHNAECIPYQRENRLSGHAEDLEFSSGKEYVSKSMSLRVLQAHVSTVDAILMDPWRQKRFNFDGKQ
jgi:hypothetical protein